MFKFSAQATAICDKMKSRNKVLKALAGSSWGADKETLLTSYNAIGRSVVSYAAPVWSANTSATQWKHIQTCQNAALRTATGCLLMTIYMRRRKSFPYVSIIICFRCSTSLGVTVRVIPTIIWWINLPHPGVSGRTYMI